MTKTYRVEVDCAACAAKMEAAAAKVAGVKTCTINFMTQKMTVEYKPEQDIEAVLRVIEKTCKKVDRDFELKD